MNRIDKTVVFHPLCADDLRKILTIELNVVQQRVFSAANAAPFVFNLTMTAKDFLLREGGSEIDCSRSLADAALLVGDSENGTGHGLINRKRMPGV